MNGENAFLYEEFLKSEVKAQQTNIRIISELSKKIELLERKVEDLSQRK